MLNLYGFIILVIFAVIILAIVAAITFLLYQQTLAHNEINKRLLTVSSEAMLSVKITQEEVERFIQGLDRTPKQESEIDIDTNPVFDPHAMDI